MGVGSFGGFNVGAYSAATRGVRSSVGYSKEPEEKQKEPKSNTPLKIIIGAVCLAVIVYLIILFAN